MVYIIPFAKLRFFSQTKKSNVVQFWIVFRLIFRFVLVTWVLYDKSKIMRQKSTNSKVILGLYSNYLYFYQKVNILLLALSCVANFSLLPLEIIRPLYLTKAFLKLFTSFYSAKLLPSIITKKSNFIQIKLKKLSNLVQISYLFCNFASPY